MDANQQRICQSWLNWGWTPEDVYNRRTRWNNLGHGWIPSEVVAAQYYERWYNERRAREAVILTDGVAQ